MRQRMVFGSPGVERLEGSRRQVVLNEPDDMHDADQIDRIVYFHVNERGPGSSYTTQTIDINSDDGDLDVVIEVTHEQLLELATMFLDSYAYSRSRRRD